MIIIGFWINFPSIEIIWIILNRILGTLYIFYLLKFSMILWEHGKREKSEQWPKSMEKMAILILNDNIPPAARWQYPPLRPGVDIKWQYLPLQQGVDIKWQYPPLQPGVVPAVRLSSSDDEAVTPTTQPLVSEKFARIFASFYFYCFVAVKFFIIFAPRWVLLNS